MNLPEYSTALMEAMNDFENTVAKAHAVLRERVETIRSAFFEDPTKPTPAETREGVRDL